jgi:predicted  nucleic acid-binding Zn-ribbon protein
VTENWFFKLKEYDSLRNMRQKVLQMISEEEGRISSLNIKLQDQLNESIKLSSHKSHLQEQFHLTEKKLENDEQQASRLRDIGGDENKIKLFELQARTHEDLMLQMLDEIETLDLKIKEIKNFTNGLKKTIEDIKSEVEQNIDLHKKEIERIEIRMKLLEEELPENFRAILQRTLKKNLALGPFTRIEQGSCYFCRYKISRLEESEIDQLKMLKVCPQCSRIFLPYGS